MYGGIVGKEGGVEVCGVLLILLGELFDVMFFFLELIMYLCL